MRLIHGLATLELPAGKIDPTSPRDHNRAPEAIDGDNVIRDRALACSGSKRLPRRLAIAFDADTPAWTAVKLGCVNAEQAQAEVAATQGIAVNNISRGTGDGIDWHDSDQAP